MINNCRKLQLKEPPKELKSIPTGRGVTIHIPCDLTGFQLLPFDLDYFDSIM